MIKKKNAFTLIELLAIIVILAIIAVITVPIILNIIDNSRKGAASDSAYGFKDAINKYYVTQLSDNYDFILDGEYDVLSGGVLNGSGIDNVVIPVSGDKPSSGSLIYENNELKSGCLVFGEYAVTFTGGSVTNTLKGECSGDNEIVFTEFNGRIYNANEYFYLDYLPENASFWVQGNGELGQACMHDSSTDNTMCFDTNMYDCGIPSIDNNNVVCSEIGYMSNKLNEFQQEGLTCEIRSIGNDESIACFTSNFKMIEIYKQGSLYSGDVDGWTCGIDSDGTMIGCN